MLKSPSVRFPEFDEVWSHTKAGEVFSNSRERGEEKLPIYSVTLNRGMVPRSDLTRKMQGDASFDKNLKVLKGNVAYNMMRMWQGAVGVAPKDCMVSPAYVVLNPNNDNVSEFFVQWFSLDRMLNLLTVYSRGLTSDRLRLYYEDFAQITMRVPSAKEQTKIAEFLGAVDEKIRLLEARHEQLTLYKKAMMQKIFSQTLRFKRDDGGEFPDWEEKLIGIVYDWVRTNSLSRANLNYKKGELQNIHYGDIHTKFSTLFRQSDEHVPFVTGSNISDFSPVEICRVGDVVIADASEDYNDCLLYTSPSPRDKRQSRMPSSA